MTLIRSHFCYQLESCFQEARTHFFIKMLEKYNKTQAVMRIPTMCSLCSHSFPTYIYASYMII